MTKTSPRPSLVPFVRVTGACIAVLLLVAVMQRPARAQWTWHAAVGAQSKDLGRQALAFLPNELWIHEGDTVTWKFEADEIHTITFLTTDPTAQIRPPFPAGCPGFNPVPVTATFDGTTCVTTPPLVKNAQFSVMFPKKGNYKVVCLVHENMTGVVHVLDPLAHLPFDQEDYNEQAADQRRDMLSDDDHDGHRGHHEARDAHHGGHGVVAGSGEVTANGGGSQTLSIMRFDHDTITIRRGGTVEWTNDDPVTPHTITFGDEPLNAMPPSGSVPITNDADGARHATITLTDSAHSGFIVAAPQERLFLPQSPLGVTRFRVTFTQAGTYPYICALHDDLGMKGKIVVLP